MLYSAQAQKLEAQGKTVRLWNAASGKLHGGPLKGLTGWVYSVATCTLDDGRALEVVATGLPLARGHLAHPGPCIRLGKVASPPAAPWPGPPSHPGLPGCSPQCWAAVRGGPALLLAVHYRVLSMHRLCTVRI